MTTTELETKAIRELILDYGQRIYDGDIKGAWNLRSKDAITIVPEQRNPLPQEESMDRYLQGINAYEFIQLRPITIHEIITSGDLAFVRMTYCTEFKSKEEDGESLVFFSRHIYILSRESDEGWKITHDTWSNVPYDDGEVP